MGKKLSVITINYNNRNGVRKTMESVISQTCFEQIEYIVIDDGSVDGSVEEIRKVSNKLSYWTTRPNRGIYPTMNEGVANAHCEYCVFLNSGDVYHDKESLARIIDKLYDYDVIVGRIRCLNDEGTVSQINTPLTLHFFFQHCIPQNASFVKLDLLKRFPFDEKYRIISDWKFFLQIIVMENASYKYEDVIIADYDCNGISSKNRDLCMRDREKVLREFFPERILMDYEHFMRGGGYQDTQYDKLFKKIKDYKYGRVFYTMIVSFLRFVSVFKKSARFSREFPFFLDSKR